VGQTEAESHGDRRLQYCVSALARAFYTAVTQYLGFQKFGDEYKVMGPWRHTASPRSWKRFAISCGLTRMETATDSGWDSNILCIIARTGNELGAEADKTPTLGKLFSGRMSQKCGAARLAEEALETRHRNLAASLQARLEEVRISGCLQKLAKATGLKSICLAGRSRPLTVWRTVKYLTRPPFEQVYVQPAAGDAGLAVGAAYYVWHQKLGKPRSFVMEHAYWGPGYSAGETRAAMESSGIAGNGHVVGRLSEQELTRRAAAIVADGKILGWFQGAGGMGAASARKSQHCS